jgi:hypothetical protein
MHFFFMILAFFAVVRAAQSLGLPHERFGRKEGSAVAKVEVLSNPNPVLHNIAADVVADFKADIAEWQKWLVKVVPITVAVLWAPIPLSQADRLLVATAIVVTLILCDALKQRQEALIDLIARACYRRNAREAELMQRSRNMEDALKFCGGVIGVAWGLILARVIARRRQADDRTTCCL